MGKRLLALAVLSCFLLASVPVAYGNTEEDEKRHEETIELIKKNPKYKWELPVNKDDKDGKKEEKKIPLPEPQSSRYMYAPHLVRNEDIPPMTDEILTKFEAIADTVKLEARTDYRNCHGKWIFNSLPQNKNDGGKEWQYVFMGELPYHQNSVFVSDIGRTTYEQHYVFIEMVADRGTGRLKSLEHYRYDITKDTGEAGLKTVILKEEYKDGKQGNGQAVHSNP